MCFITSLKMEYGPLNRFLRTILGIACESLTHLPRAREKIDDWDAVPVVALRHAHVLAFLCYTSYSHRFFVAGVFLATTAPPRDIPHFGADQAPSLLEFDRFFFGFIYFSANCEHRENVSVLHLARALQW